MSKDDSIQPNASTVHRRDSALRPKDAPGNPSSSGPDDLVSEEAQTVIRGSSVGRASGFSASAGGAASGGALSGGNIDRSPASVAKVLSGQNLNHFHLQELIGGGGMGAVFRARDEHLDRVVAIKVIPFVGDDVDLGRRFRNEAQSAAKLDHPNIARVFDVGQVDHWNYIVFEFVQGTNIRDRVIRDGPFSIDDAVFATCQLAGAIGHAAERGIVHRDIKPSNVVINADEQIKLVDMGLARSENVELSEDMTASGVTLGTFDYISPEQALDPRDADVRSDIYSLGCTLYFMITGQPPYPGGTMLQKLLSHGNAPPPDPRSLRQDASDDLVLVLQKMLAKSPGDRYQNVTDLIADLQEVAAREGLKRSLSIARPLPSSEGLWTPAIRQFLPWGVAVVVLLAVALWLQIDSRLRDNELQIQMPDRIGMVTESDAIPPARRSPMGDQRQPASGDTRTASPSGTRNPDTPIDPPGPPATNGFEVIDDPSGSADGAAVTGRVADAPGAAVSDSVAMPGAVGDADTSPSETAAGIDVPSVATTKPPADRSPPSLGTALPDGKLALPMEIAPPLIARVIDQLDNPYPGLNLREVTVEGVAYVNSLSDAFDLARVHRLDRIELAAKVIRTGPIRVPVDSMQIVSVVDRTLLWVQADEDLSMQRSQLIDVGDRRTEWDGIDFFWDVGATEADGGTLFSVGANRMFRMTDCTVTVRNSSRHDHVYAMEVNADSEESFAAMPDSDETVTVESPTLPLVAIEMENVAIRGEMTLLHLSDAAELQLKWNNGFLAVSQRFMDCVGAAEPPSATTPAMQVEISRLTASIPEGFYRARMGFVESYPVTLKRQADRCVFLQRTGVPHFEIRGIDPSASIKSLIQTRGQANAYVYPQATALEDPLVSIGEINQPPRQIRLDTMIAEEPEDWSSEKDPLWSVRWSVFPLPTRPPSELLSEDFRQDGSILSGFDLQTLPPLPPIAWD
ncbi:serine/threonine-protein kinase [Crateriforma conspicua]|uniref:Serine/threonine-protein kinase PrkC n=1 Tax=Crateriforma conspicua TaxID=2527996 RepID=A0A5C5YAW1_9PLAN|nr:serine/threonine-protein kinase [Crateriforma conspicua]QDV65035.1 Serine/threonine-protein kinase PrkC [Crateriforma conspicua]TWT70432.1 Serine/threonine-protein kinase PrkC [Crateriforma conspicua]